MLRLIFVLLALALPAHAEEVVAGLSKNQVSITTNFGGSEIIVFGAVKRDAPAPAENDLAVIVTVSGPSQPVVVRRKDRRFGIWVNTDAVEVDAAPTFYAVATSVPMSDAMSEVEDLRHHISIDRAIRSVGAADTVTDAAAFTEALIRIRSDAGAYQTLENTVELTEATLFRAEIALPANLTEGDYATRIFLTRDGTVIDTHDTVIFVQKVGLERLLFSLSRERPLIYGLLSLFIAIVAGWGASAFFRYVRG